MSTPNTPLHRPAPVRAAWCTLVLVLLSVLTTACAQEAPPPAPAPEDTREWPHQFDGLVSADAALDRIEADLAAGRSAGTPTLFRSISANGDPARHFARSLRLARLFAARNDEVGASRMLVALWAMGAQRPFFRALVFDAARDHVMATAAMRVLAYDPRQEEYDEFAAFRATLSPSPSTQSTFGVGSPETLNEIITEYGSRLGVVEAYEAIPSVRGKLDFLRRSVTLGGWYESQFRALYVAHPAEVEAWISSLVIAPPSPLSPIQHPPDWVIRRNLLDVAQAPPNIVLPPTIEGPLLPASPLVRVCNGFPATVYVAAGRVVGGPLDGALYVGRLVGTDGADVILGTDNPDAIDARAGDDTVCAGAGNDAINAGPGTDTVDGGPGTDGCDAAETATACEGAVPALTDVRPVLECVAPDGAGFVAYYGYENRSGAVSGPARAGRVAYGSNNRITPAALDRAQPDLFGLPGVVAGRPGRTPFYPGHGFTVRFAAGQTVVWKLFNRTSTASASSPRCPAP